jgi:type IV pilus assembly protein PilA
MALFCAACGNSMTADDRFCRVCGRVAAAAPGITSSTGAPILQGSAETSGKAFASLICGLLFFIPFLFVAAIVFGHLALSEIRKSAGRLKGEGIAMAGLVLGYLWIAGIPIILIIAAIAIPNVLRARIAANESSAIGSLRTLGVAEVSYATLHPSQGYTCSLSDLTEAAFIRGPLATGQKNGYVFELTGCSARTDSGANVKYQAVAYPLRVNQTGMRAFCSDESHVVKVDSSGSARGCTENGSILQR